MVGITYDPWSWGLVGDALRDAADGDASTLAALASYLMRGYPAPDGPEDEGPLVDFGAAHFAIYCADFSHVVEVWGCDGMPDGRSAPGDHGGRRGRADPRHRHRATIRSTPGHHAAEIAAALGDAVAIMWEGVGHTAFPVTTCLDGAVIDHLLDGAVPDDGLRCPFVDGTTTDAEIGDHLFALPVVAGATVAGGRVRRRGRRARPRASAGSCRGVDHRVRHPLVLGVESVAAADARAVADGLLTPFCPSRPPDRAGLDDAGSADRDGRRARPRGGPARRSRCPCRRRR